MKPTGGWSSRTHCKHGHEFTPENTRIEKKRGHRVCRACIKRRSGAYIGKQRERLRQIKVAIRVASKSSVKTPSIPSNYKHLGEDEFHGPS